MHTLGTYSVSRRRLLSVAATGSAGLMGAALVGCSSSARKPAEAPKAPVSPGGGAPQTVQPKSGGILKYSVKADVETLDRYRGSAPTGWSLATGYTYSQLFNFEKGTEGKRASGKIVGDLIKSWEMRDPTTIVMKIDPAAKFDPRPPTNGRQVTAEDIVRSWKRFEKEADTRVSLANSANKNAPVVDMTAIDAGTVQVKLAFPDALALPLLAGSSTTIHTQPVEGIDGKFDLTKDMRGSGPFMLENYQRGVGFVFKRNPAWHLSRGVLPYLDEVNIRIIPDTAQAEVQFRAKNLAGLTAVSQENIPQFAKELKDTKVVIATPGGGGPLIGLSWAPDQPWKDIRVRRALSMSIDRDTFVDTIFDPKRFKDIGVSLNAYWNTPLSAGWGDFWLNPKSKDFGPAAAYLQHNVAEAKKLLDAAGYTAQKPLEFDMVYPGVYYGRDWPTRVDTFQSMAADTGALKMKHASIDYTKYINGYWRGGAKFAGINQKNAAQFPPGGGSNISALDWLMQYFTAKGSNTAAADAWPDLEEMLNKQRQVIDFETQKNALWEVQRYVVDNMVAIPVGPITESVDLVWKQLHGPGEIQNWPGGFPSPNGGAFWLEGPIG